ncbi:MAG: nitrous oxide-stimulated promoter family protein [Clostridia bacterium]|nr:nitrous oxide-stimulated promoter family protein [Clostridia bacterium]
MDIRQKKKRKKAIVSEMIALYCKKNHGTDGLCHDCAALDAYARERTERCPFTETRAFCSGCTVHCYREEMRERIRAVMRFSGPRMLFYHPLMLLRHVASTAVGKMKGSH